jgi:hypothetical protein
MRSARVTPARASQCHQSIDVDDGSLSDRQMSWDCSPAPACASCNVSKHNDEVTGWLRRKKLDERTFLVRQTTILRDLRPVG